MKKGKLFYKFLIIFLVVSLGPLGYAGWYLINLSQDTLKESILRDQKSLAVGFAGTVHDYVMAFRNVLFDTARLEEFSLMDISRQRTTINRLMQLHAAFPEISVFDAAGNETIRLGRFSREHSLRNFSKSLIFNKALRDGEFIGGMERFMGSYPTLTIAIQIANSETRAVGVLMAKLSLNGLSSILKTGFPETTKTQAAVIDTNGFLVAHSDLSIVFKSDARLPKEVEEILLRNDAPVGGGEILIAGGERALCAFAEVEGLEWVVYIQRSFFVVNQALTEMLSRTYWPMGMIVVFVLLLGYAVSAVITQPIQTLREAAVKLGQGQFEDLPELKMPNDEIGELAHAFSQMSDSLRAKTEETIAAKEELEKFNRTLENRVEARTRELKSAQTELIQKERLAAVGEMASVVGHEIRNPLAVINNSAYFIKTKLGAMSNQDPKVMKHISIIESEIQQANGIISEILGFTRTRELNPKMQYLNVFIEDLLSSYPFPQRIKLVKKLSPDNPVVNIDTDEMKQAVRNLIGNAVEVMPDGGDLGVITETMKNSVCIDVVDSGPGIPKEKLDKIFTPFFTTKARGTGLGLAVVRKVIDRHKGKIEVLSASGRGTTFKLYLPLAAGNSKSPVGGPRKGSG